MNTHQTRITLTALAAAIALVLSACGGGGGGGMVRATPPPAAPPPTTSPPTTPAPVPASGPCPMPITGDCTVQGEYTLAFDEYGMSGGRQSDHKLFVHGGNAGGGWVNLNQGEYRFSGGTEIAGATLVVWDTLVSDVRILRDYTGLGFTGDSELWLLGTVRGNVRNEQLLNLRCWSGLHACSSIPQQRIIGNYTQAAEGTLELVPGRHLDLTGTATLDGSLLLSRGDAAYVLPNAPSSILLLHADAGVSGAFARWSTSALFLEGALRYTTNDVFFDASRISVQSAMAGQGFGGMTLASAGNLDRALAVADGFTGNPTPTQQRFLASAGRLLWMRDPLQAQRALDTLSGLPQLQALDAALQEAGMSPALAAHLDRRVRSHAAGAWSRTDIAGVQAGFDQWLGPRLLAGVHAMHGGGAQANTRLDARAQGDERRAGVYLRWSGDGGWYAGADAGHARQALLLDRRIDFGTAGRWNAQSRRTLDVVNLGGEAGRALAVAGGSLTPFLRLDAFALRGGETIEQGESGFELALAAVNQRTLATSAGLRYARDWRLADGGWLQLQAGAGVQRAHWASGDAQQASFTGAPAAWFDLPGSPRPASSWLDLGLRGGFGHGWGWTMQATRRKGIAEGDAWRLRVERAF